MLVIMVADITVIIFVVVVVVDVVDVVVVDSFVSASFFGCSDLRTQTPNRDLQGTPCATQAALPQALWCSVTTGLSPRCRRRLFVFVLISKFLIDSARKFI